MGAFCGTPFFQIQEEIIGPISNSSGATITPFDAGNATAVSNESYIFTQCFIDMVLVQLPCLFLQMIGPVHIQTLLRIKTVVNPKHTVINISKTVVPVLLALLCMVHWFYMVNLHVNGIHTPFVSMIAPFVRVFTMIMAIGCIQCERLKGKQNSGLLFLHSLLQTIFEALILQSQIRKTMLLGTAGFSIPIFVSAAWLIFSLIEMILCNLAEPQSDIKKNDKICPEKTSTVLSRITWWWFTGYVLNSMVIQGYKKPLTKANLWNLMDEDTSRVIVPKFEKQWKKQCIKANKSHRVAYSSSMDKQVNHDKTINGDVDELSRPLHVKEPDIDIKDGAKCKQPSLVKSLIATFWRTFLYAAFLKLCQDMLIFVNPQVLSRIIKFVSDEDQPMWHGFLLAGVMFLSASVQSMFIHHYFHKCFITGMRLRAALISAIYKKSLKLSNSSRKGSTLGEITNLMAVDAQKFVDVSTQLNLVWSAPLQMIFALFFLFQTLGPSVIAGFVVMVLLIPVNAFVAKKSRNFQMRQMKQKDARLKLMSEILNGMKVLKLYAWEKSFEAMVLAVRGKELSILKKSSYLNAISSFTWTCAPFLVSLTTFGVYVLSSPDNHLDAQKAFVSLSLFNILKFPLTMLPQLIASLVQVSVSVKRLSNFLNNEELDPDQVQHLSEDDTSNAISIENANFNWSRDEEVPTLSNLSFDAKRGSLVAVVGSVGSGKSSVLSALLGEMDKMQGSLSVNGSVAYVPQQAWMQNATLKNNILFGKVEDECFYYKVLRTCALEKDLEMLAAADETEIGEKGINLSGGQKQRISLARAVYADADIYLLDDPLSAVDSHVGKHIFDYVISSKEGVLKDKTRVLVTNAISFLPQVDQIIVLVDGQISEMGSYKELVANNYAFAEFVNNYLMEKGEEEGGLDDIDEDTKTIIEDCLSHRGVVITDEDKKNLEEEGGRPKYIKQLSRMLSTQLSVCKEDDMSPMLKRRMHRQGAINSESSTIGSKTDISKPKKTPITQFGRQQSVVSRFRMDSEISRQMSIMSNDDQCFEDDIDTYWPGEKNDEKDFCTMDDRPDSLKKATKRKAPLQKQVTIAGGTCEIPEALKGKKEEADKLIKAETAETGKVKLDVFLTYARNIRAVLAILIVMFYIGSNACSVGSNFWLSSWSDDHRNVPINGTSDPKQRNIRLGVYCVLGFSQACCVLLASFTFANGRIRAASKLHHGMLSNILRSKLAFFDSTPLGRITNRFSKDIDMIDMVIPMTISAWIQTTLMSLSTIIVISIKTPWFLTVLVPLAVLYFIMQRFFIATSRQIKRLDSVSRSPIYSHFGETIQGASTIRAFGRTDQFITESQNKVDDNQQCYYHTLIANRWLAVRLEFVGNCIVLFAAIFAVIGRSHLDPGDVGLSITYAMSVTQVLNMMVRMNSEVEANIVAVERVKEYSDSTVTQGEADWELEENKPSKEWPVKGQVSMSEYGLRYREDLDLVLKSITCEIKGGEKIGIVGRTGAGKSSLTMALFRIVEPAKGVISIDGIDIATIGLHDLRSKLTIIPQDPVLFSGTLRMNLDPFEERSDEDLWTALEHAHLKNHISTLPGKLYFLCSEGGENLSVGQRQLVCLARALLRKTRVLILDEATAAVDLETDDLIQATIKTEFSECTVLTIAHRLNTILDYDRIMVLDAGNIAELDHPHKLLQNRDSIFHGMAKDANLVD